MCGKNRIPHISGLCCSVATRQATADRRCAVRFPALDFLQFAPIEVVELGVEPSVIVPLISTRCALSDRSGL